MTGIRVGMRLGELSEGTLRFYRQIGVEAVELPQRYSTDPPARPVAPLLPPAEQQRAGAQPPPYKAEDLRRMRERAEEFGLEAIQIMLPVGESLSLGRPGREQDMESVCRSIEAAGKAGIGAMRYTFRSLRPNPGYYLQEGAGRGGATLRAFDYDRVRDHPPLDDIGRQTKEQMWERLTWFLERAVPAAEATGVRLAVHPSDPPPPAYRGVEQPLATLADMKRLIETVDSPSNCIIGHPGVFTEMGEDPVAAIRYFGERKRIGGVHFRSVSVQVPYEKYIETFHDEGDTDLVGAMRAFHEVGFSGLLEPDHTAGMSNDSVDHKLAWAQAVGYVLGLRNATAGASV